MQNSSEMTSELERLSERSVAVENSLRHLAGSLETEKKSPHSQVHLEPSSTQFSVHGPLQLTCGQTIEEVADRIITEERVGIEAAIESQMAELKKNLVSVGDVETLQDSFADSVTIKFPDHVRCAQKIGVMII